MLRSAFLSSSLFFLFFHLSVIATDPKNHLALELMNTNVTNTFGLRLSPQCWLSAVELFARFQEYQISPISPLKWSTGSQFCSTLGNSEQQVLALELTKCHLMSAGRQLPTLSCHTNADTSSCLSQLDGFDFTIYTQFFLHVNEICHRLTESLLIQKKLEATLIFEDRAMAMEAKLEDALHRWSDMKSHMDVAHAILNEISNVKQLYLEASSRIVRFFSDKNKANFIPTIFLFSQIATKIIVVWIISSLCFPTCYRFQVRSILLLMASIFSVADASLLKLYENGFISDTVLKKCLHSIRSIQYPCYISVSLLAWIVMTLSAKFVRYHDKTTFKDSPRRKYYSYTTQSCEEEIDRLRSKLELEVERRRTEQELLTMQLAFLQQQYVERSINVVTPAKGQNMERSSVVPHKSQFSIVSCNDFAKYVDSGSCRIKNMETRDPKCSAINSEVVPQSKKRRSTESSITESLEDISYALPTKKVKKSGDLHQLAENS